jgi:hypothetical protein
VAIDRIPLPAHVPGRLYATGFTDIGPDPDRALATVDADTLLCLLTQHDIDLRFPAFTAWLEANRATGRGWWFPIEDGGVADDEAMVALVDALAAALRAGRRVVTHCGAGIGRTSLACGLAVVVLSEVGLDAALAQVRAARPGAGPENPQQRSHLQRLADRLADRPAGRPAALGMERDPSPAAGAG